MNTAKYLEQLKPECAASDYNHRLLNHTRLYRISPHSRNAAWQQNTNKKIYMYIYIDLFICIYKYIYIHIYIYI